MKIILLLGRRQGGGTEAHANWLLGALRNAGFETGLYSLFPNHWQSRFYEVFSEVFGLQLARDRFLRIAKAEQVDLVICFGRLANCCGYEIKRQIPGVSLIATCRTNRWLPISYRKTLAAADLVLTNSDWATRRVTRISNVSAAKVKTVPNSLLYPELANSLRDSLKMEVKKLSFGLDPSRPVLGMLAHFVRGKNQEFLIRMLAEERLPAGTQLLLAGSGPRLIYCRRMIRRLGLGAEVCFPGNVEDPSGIFEASDLIVSTSLRDSMPNALIEAQAAGLPVVAFDVAGVGESFTHRESGLLVPVAEAQAMADSIGTLLADGELRNCYSKRAREQAVRRFDPNRVLKDYTKEIGSLF